MKSIAMVGALWTRNFGDVLLADLFRKKVESLGWGAVYPTIDKGVAQDLGVQQGGTKSILKSKKCLFFGGGYLSEPPQRKVKWALSRYARIFIYADICRLLRIKYYIVGVGAGPCRTPVSRFIFKRFCENAEKIVVRDEYSRETLINIGVKSDIEVSCDYALTLSRRSSGRRGPTKKVALHLTSNQPALNSNIISHFERNEGEDVWFIEDHPGEYEKVKSSNPNLISLVGDRVVRYSSHFSFIEDLDSFEFIVTSKLHVGIVAATLGKKICSFPYHEKVIRFYEDMNRPELCFSSFSDRSVSEHIISCMQSKPVLVPEALLDKLVLADNALNSILSGISET